jgi:predicted nucleotidyltransferase
MKRRKPLAKSKALSPGPKPTLEEIKLMLHDRLPQLREEYGVGTLWLFGSYVRGEQHRRSDLDVLVEFKETPTLPELIGLERHMRQIIGVKVDLVSVGALKGEIGERILNERVPV